MADEEKKPEQAPADSEAVPQKRRAMSMGTVGIFGGIMLVEGLAIFFCMKFLGADPDPTAGMIPELTTTAPYSDSREFELSRIRVQNNHGQRTILYAVGVTIRVNNEDDNVETVTEFLEFRKATIDDAISRIIRSADEQHLAEPGLETLKRQIRYELSALLGDDTIIEQVLIPEFTPLPTGF